MSQNENTLTTFETRVRQMILRFQELRKENEELHTLIGKNEQDIQELRAKLTQADNDYNSLKMAKMMEITDGDLEHAKARLAKLIRDVNKCIGFSSKGDEPENTLNSALSLCLSYSKILVSFLAASLTP